MIIREASMNDLEKIFPVFLEGYMFHYNGRKDVFSEPNELMLRDTLIEDLCSIDKKTLILINQDEVIGYLQYEIKLKHKDKVLWIDELVIKEAQRKKGYAKKLMEYVENIAHQIKAKRIELNCWEFNTNALKMYDSLEFNTQRVILEKFL